MASSNSGPTIQVRRDVAIAVGLALGLALLLIAFLLGRASVRSPAPAAISEVAAAEPALPAAEPRVAPPAPESLAPLPDATDVTLPAPDPGLRAGVARYFSELDAVQALAKRWTDPQQFAQEVVQQGVQGRTGGFDDLLATERQARERVAAMAVPPPCRQHHAAVLGLLDEAIGLLGRVKQALASQDILALESLAATARELEARSRKVDEAGAGLKRQYGLPSP